MIELLHFAFAPVNLLFTFLLLLILLYWLTVIIGLLDFSFLDLHLDLNHHIHFHKDIHINKGVHIHKDIHTGVAHGEYGWATILSFFNLSSVPFMIVMSFLILFLWMGSILGNHYLGSGSIGIAFLLFIPNLLIGLFLTKLITSPLKSVFKDTPNEFETNRHLIGQTCTILLSAQDQKLGQAEVAAAKGAPLLLMVKTTEGNKMARGEKGLIIDYDKNNHTFLIEPLN
jgi:hypothetical protein